MKPTDFAYYLSKYLNHYLPGQQNFSSNTINSYKDAFKLFLRFCKEEKDMRPDRISFDMFNKELVNGFIKWLGEKRDCSESMQNQRLTVIRSFFAFVQEEAPERMFLCQSIANITVKKKQPHL